MFSLRCRDEGIIPASLRMRTPVKTRKIAEKAFLSARIHQSYLVKESLEKKSIELDSELKSKMKGEDLHLIDKMCAQPAEREFAKTRKRHK